MTTIVGAGETGGSERGALVDRDAELQHLLEVAADDQVELVKITGMPGVGKTRLARALIDAVPSGGLLVPLATVTDGRRIGDALVGHLPRFGDEADPTSDRPWDPRRGGRFVVVLDDVDGIDGL